MVNIRLASIEDAEEIVLIKKEIVFSTEVFLRTPSEPQEEAKDYQKKIKLREVNGGITLIAEYNNQVVGFLSFSRPTYMRVNHTGTFGMGIKKGFRKQGIGISLLSYLIEWGKKQKGLEKICLEVFSNNEQAIQLYRRLGFKEEGKQINQLQLKDGSYSDLIFMSLFL